jgi:hypothetical protein
LQDPESTQASHHVPGDDAPPPPRLDRDEDSARREDSDVSSTAIAGAPSSPAPEQTRVPGTALPVFAGGDYVEF